MIKNESIKFLACDYMLKNRYKSFLCMLIGLFVLCTSVHAEDKPIKFNQLPALSQKTVKNNFSNKQVATVERESGARKSYEVRFTDGDEIEFNGDGTWREVKSRHSAVPDSFVPKPVKSYVNKHYPNTRICEIERVGKRTEVKLSNGLEIEFSAKYEVVKIDD